MYAITFHGMAPQKDLNVMLASVQNCLYHKMSEIIPLFLKQRYLENSNFASIEIPLGKHEAMDWAGYLLHSGIYKEIDGSLEGVDVYYAVMDYQKSFAGGRCKGCYYALKRLSLGNGNYHYNPIGQTFFSDLHTCEEHGYFSIRKTKGNALHTIDSSVSAPVFPTFGCVNMLALLPNIEDVQTKEDARNAAIK